ncbi:MAG: PQQ-dependent sugar dehydrogenase [Aeromicrobium erythreum]
MKALLRGAAVLVLALPLLSATPAQAADPELVVTPVAEGLQNPWAMTFLPDGSMLYTQRDRRTVTLRTPDGTSRVVLDKPAGMWAGGETGLMGIERSVSFSSDRQFFVCHGYRSGSTRDVRVTAWRLDASLTRATFVRNLVTGLPSTSGRHGGCALQRGSRTSLYVGTGDAATGTASQNKRSGGGKVLRISAVTGKGYSGNPFLSSKYPLKRLVWTWGHRNVQGLARQPGTGLTFSVEHGSYRDDEVNVLGKAYDFGWNPVPRRKGDPSYNEGANSPMTDYALPGSQRAAVWRSGNPTIAPSGADFVSGSAWGSFDGMLAMGVLKGQQLRLLKLDASRKVVRQVVPAALDDTYGRLRGVRRGPDGALYVTTSNGSNDKILKITPRPS